jgi:hypothetical protein
MKTAVLIRGHHHYEEHLGKPNTSEIRMTTSPKQFDYREFYHSIIKNIINPIKNLQASIDIYISTYHSKIEETLFNLEHFKNINLLNIDGSSQILTLKKGLDIIPNQYDSYLILRFDLLYKKPITDFWQPKNEEKIFLTWKETEHLWKSHNRIGDALFIINGKKSFEDFKNGIKKYLHTEDYNYNTKAKDGEIYFPTRSAHYAYPFIKNETNNIEFLVDGYYDTGTSIPNPLCKNPIYIQAKRPYYFDDYPEN